MQTAQLRVVDESDTVKPRVSQRYRAGISSGAALGSDPRMSLTHKRMDPRLLRFHLLTGLFQRRNRCLERPLLRTRTHGAGVQLASKSDYKEPPRFLCGPFWVSITSFHADFFGARVMTKCFCVSIC